MSTYSYDLGSSSAGIGSVLMTLIVAGFSALPWRVVCEIWIVIFSINDPLAALARNTERNS